MVNATNIQAQELARAQRGLWGELSDAQEKLSVLNDLVLLLSVAADEVGGGGQMSASLRVVKRAMDDIGDHMNEALSAALAARRQTA